MRRLLAAMSFAFLACIVSGCGEDQPNTPPPVTQQDAISAGDMMKKANTGMDRKNIPRPGATTPAAK